MTERWKPTEPHPRLIVEVHSSMQPDNTPCACKWCEGWRAERAAARRKR
jgi:hypothetical protein